MLEKPDIPDNHIASALREEYGLETSRLEFLPLGADVHTSVYRVTAEEGGVYFLKLRTGSFQETLVLVPHFLIESGIQAVIPPLETIDHRLWARMGEYWMILYPFIEGLNGYETTLSDVQWVEFGANLKGIHTSTLPPELKSKLHRETYPAHWREKTKRYQAMAESARFIDAVAVQLAAFMRQHRESITHLVTRAGELAQALQSKNLDFVLCHSDIHAGNLLIVENGPIYIVDWDDPILAPKERDLMFIGSTHLWSGEWIEELFYQGYGLTTIDPAALAYYRIERIVVDIAEFAEQILGSEEGGEDREQSYGYFTGQFLPGHEIDLALNSDRL